MVTVSNGPLGLDAQGLVTLLLEMTAHQVPGARQRLAASMNAAGNSLRMYSVLAMAAFDLAGARERLVAELTNRDWLLRLDAATVLLHLDDARGIPIVLDELGNDEELARSLACQALRAFTQQPFPCDAEASSATRAAQVVGWREWWTSAPPAFTIKTLPAELDRRRASSY